MIKKCLVCDKEFRTYLSKIKAGKGKYCSKKCSHKKTDKCLEENGINTRFKNGQKAHNKKGFWIKKTKTTSYKILFKPDYSNCDRKGYIPEHRFIMEKYLGRCLHENEEIHHIDYDGLNNDIDNLQLATKDEHKRIHLKDTVHRRWNRPR